VGVIHEHLGTHVFPDRHAEGLKEGQHLYNVRFDAQDLWGEEANKASFVYVALWEEYLEGA
jgi:nitrile hydratase